MQRTTQKVIYCGKYHWPFVVRDFFLDATDILKSEFILSFGRLSSWSTQRLRVHIVPHTVLDDFSVEALIFHIKPSVTYCHVWSASCISGFGDRVHQLTTDAKVTQLYVAVPVQEDV